LPGFASEFVSEFAFDFVSAFTLSLHLSLRLDSYFAFVILKPELFDQVFILMHLYNVLYILLED